MIWQAESPDEEALVEGAAEMGIRLKKRSVSTCIVEVRCLQGTPCIRAAQGTSVISPWEVYRAACCSGTWPGSRD